MSDANGRIASEERARLKRWERLLELRQLEERARLRAAAAARAELAELCTALAQIGRERARMEAETLARRGDTLDLAAEQRARRALGQLIIRQELHAREIAVARARADERRAEAHNAGIARRAAETLIDRQRRRVERVERRSEQRTLDASARDRFLNRAAGRHARDATPTPGRRS